MSHPSRLAVERHVLGAPSSQLASAELAAHLTTCAECRRHVEAVSAAEPVPAWVLEASRLLLSSSRPLESSTPLEASTPLQSSRPRRTWWRPLGLAAAVAASLVIFLWPASPPSTAKGAPAVTVWLKRGDTIAAWDGRSPLRSGDDIRLEAAPGDFGYVTVVSTASEKPTALFQAKVDPSGKPTLSPAWRLDGQGTEEHLAVLFTREPVADDAPLGPLLTRRDGDAWCIHEVLPKESR